MFIYVLPKEMSSPNTGGTHKITSPGSLARENLTRTFNCTPQAEEQLFVVAMLAEAVSSGSTRKWHCLCTCPKVGNAPKEHRLAGDSPRICEARLPHKGQDLVLRVFFQPLA